MNLPELLTHFENVSHSGGGRYIASCSSHDDSTPSLSLTQDARTGNILISCFAGCSFADVAHAAGLQESDFFGDPGAPGAVNIRDAVQADFGALRSYVLMTQEFIFRVEVQEYLERRFRMPEGMAEALGLGFDDGDGRRTRPDGFRHLGDGKHRLVVPFFDPDGGVVGVQARRIGPCGPSERWQMPAGGGWSKVGVFGWELECPVIITEGPTDALAAVVAGYPALFIRGSKNFGNEGVHATVREWLGDRSAVIVRDDDQSGEQAATVLGTALGIPVWKPPTGGDLADFLAGGGSIKDAIDAAEAVPPPVDEIALLRDELQADLVGALRNQDLLGRLNALMRSDLDWIRESIIDSAPDRQLTVTRERIDRVIAAVRGVAPRAGNGGGADVRAPGQGAGPTRPLVTWDPQDQLEVTENQVRHAMDEYSGTEYFGVAAGSYVKVSSKTNDLVPLDNSGIRSMLSRMGHWRVLPQENGHVPVEAAHMVSSASWECEIDVINRRVEVPFMLPDGDIVSSPGYHAETGIFLLPKDNIEVPPVPSIVTPADLDEAREVFEDVLCDFLFVDDASKANLIAMTLTSPLREVMQVKGPMVPLLVATAPQEGSGKGTSIRVPLSTAGVGSMGVATTAFNPDEVEFEKKLVAKLLKKSPYVFLDNIRGTVNSGVLEQMLTAPLYDGRKLGFSEVNALNTLVLWVATLQATGAFNRDLSRRSVPVVLRKNVKGNWRHSNIETYLNDNRGRLIWACFVTARKWMQDGGPLGTAKLDGYGGWASVMGGMVEHTLGYEGFLGNRLAFATAQDERAMTLGGILERWLEVHGEKPGPVTNAAEDFEDPALAEMLGLRGANTTKTKFGLTRALQSADGHAVGETHVWISLGKQYHPVARQTQQLFCCAPRDQEREIRRLMANDPEALKEIIRGLIEGE